jgi:hypothetical protein
VSKIKRSRDARSIYTCSQALRHDMALALVYLRGIHGLCLRIFSHTSLRLNRVLGEEKAAHMRLVVGVLVWTVWMWVVEERRKRDVEEVCILDASRTRAWVYVSAYLEEGMELRG